MFTQPISRYHEERRLVTVLFADLVKFTPLAESLDPEEIGDLLNRLWAAFDAIVVQHGGRVDKHLGDSLMAVWGAPRGTEDDAERAVMCALTLQRKLEALNTDFAQSAYPELHMRVGLNSGSVVAVVITSTSEYSVIGDVVNVANRLENIAPPGGVVIGPGTYRLVRDIFRLQALPPQALRGKTAPVEAFLVIGPETHPVRVRYRMADSLDVRLVGREAELSRLQQAFHLAYATRQPQLALLTGEAGMGKSRLLFEFTHRLELTSRQVLLFSTRALAENATLPFFVWESMWANRLGMMKDEPEAGRREKFSRGLQEVWGKRLGQVSGIEVAHVLGHLIGLDWPGSPYLASLRADPAALQARVVELTTELFRRAAITSPVVLALDDVQSADAASLELLDALLDQGNLPLLIVGASRLSPENLRPVWAARDPAGLHHLVVGPLALTEEMVTTIFSQAATLPAAFRRRLATSADGNPYFLEEMVKTLLQTGIMVSRPDGWHLPGEQAPESIPLSDSLRAQLQARLDALSPPARAVALAASVVGRTFWAGILEALLQHTNITKLLTPPPDGDWNSPLDSALQELQRQELVFERRGSTFVSEREFIFKHNLLRETAYNLLPRKYRQPYHALVADWLASRPTPDYALAVAEHYARARQADRAAHYYQLAAEHLRQRGYVREATAAANAAIAIKGG